MYKLTVDGGKRLAGEVTAGGAKNSALPILVASILTQEPCTVERVPDLRDVNTVLQLLSQIGAEVERKEDQVSICTARIKSSVAPYELVKTMRASVLLLGPLLAREGKVSVSLPGGCAIGERPINLHLLGLEKLGAEIELAQGYVHLRAAKGLKGCHIYLDIPTVTGTMNLIMAASQANGKTVIENAAREPEVSDLAKFLTAMGLQIHGAGTSVIEVSGPTQQLCGVKHKVIADRIETGTYLAAAAITGGEVKVNDCCPQHLESLLEKFKALGCQLTSGENWIRLKSSTKLLSTDIKTLPYPGFATDMQAQFMAMLCLASGTSVITETIFENRFMHAAELKRMGARIKVRGASAVVEGVAQLCPADVMATDLRASASLVLAALAAEGTSHIHRLYHLERGYGQMEHKLASLGASVRKEKE